MEKLTNEEWFSILRNLNNMEEEDYFDGEINWIEILYLDSTNEYVLCYGYKIFEDGFKSEEDVIARLNEVEKLYSEYLINKVK